MPQEPAPHGKPQQIPRLPRVNALTAVTIAVASLAAAVAVLVLVPDDIGRAAAGAIATAGLTLAGRMGTPR
ncbi:hypothetical protein KDA82_00950 [Streptomyces daliensis]|uniref:Uncharacterized protein n=1 Tax=Streptomyces daliensis TaxID=299421 RepID=A0A8T4IPG5_9ACTN|nr:hypothetical protein [Streptomyces daliensis]